MIVQHNRILSGGASAYAYDEQNNEIGLIEMVADHGYYRIDMFMVREAYRNQGIGTQLMDLMKKDFIEDGGTELKVIVWQENYDGDSSVSIEELYKIFEKLGFEFVDEDVDRTRQNSEMVYRVEAGE